MHETTSTLNIAQTIFALFYAVMWGTLANVWPRWRAFDVVSQVMEGSRAVKRWVISFCFLNLTPILFFIVIFINLRSWQLSGPSWWDAIQLIVVMIQPFVLVGIYWIWIGIMQQYRTTFYPEPLSDAYNYLREKWDLSPDLAKANFLWGLGYVLLPPFLLGIIVWIR